MAVELDDRLLEILACPAPDHGSLRREPDGGVLACTDCGRRFPITDGIPVLLLDEALDEPETERGDGDGV